MTNNLRSARPYIKHRVHRGQMLIIALAILFVLLFIGGIFVTQIARNLAAAGRGKETQTAQAYAEAGIRYCDSQLTYSEDGADWRPVPTPPITTAGIDPLGLTDPDYQWLQQGFTRVYFNGGRALVRVTYDPHPDDPRSQLIKVEAVGRTGDLANGTDPTVFVQTQNPPRLRREQIAYKQIGLTDYLFFITNKDKRSVDNFIGVPFLEDAPLGISGVLLPNSGFHDLAMVLGDPSIPLHLDPINPDNNGVNKNETLYGASIRCNANLRFGGDVRLFCSPRGTLPSVSPEGILATGSILLAPTRDLNNDPNNNAADNTTDDNDLQVTVNQNLDLATNSLGDPNAAFAVHTSSDPNFNTYGGLIRDGSAQPDVFGFSRGIPRLDPPLIDYFVNGSGVLRYRALTRDSGRWVNQINTGQTGWGRGIYVDNTDDLQMETSVANVNGASSLRAEWLDPRSGNTLKQGYGWEGPFYHAPGVLVELLGDHIRLTRTDHRTFRKPDGTEITPQGSTVIDIPLSDFERANYHFPDGTAFPLPPLPRDGDQPSVHPNPNQPYGDPNSYGVNVVIMAEGNVRVRGVYGAITDPGINSEDAAHNKVGRVHVTIVSGGTAYIEGNVLKGDGFKDNTGLNPERASTCAILAKDYICVNTTMFMAPENQTNVWSLINRDLSDFAVQLGQTRPTYDTRFSFGQNPNSYVFTQGGAQNASPEYLMLRQAALDNGLSPVVGINLFVNQALGMGPPPDSSQYIFGVIAGSPETYALGSRPVGGVPTPDPAQITPRYEQKAFSLGDTNNNYRNMPLVTQSGYDNLLRFQVDQRWQSLPQNVQISAGGSTDYMLGGAMVAPLDIRIEAALYAQERSFFVIPGYALNPDPNDSRQLFLQTAGRTSYSVSSNGTPLDTIADRYNKDLFPFYNEPLDVRITIFGSIAENYTASMGDQAAWLAKWGYIPALYGSTFQYPNGPNPAAQPLQVPDDHMFVHDPAVYNPGEDHGTVVNPTDFRTTLERNENITRGLRYIYDPALAMPYEHPTDHALTGEGAMPTALRKVRTLRAIVQDVKYSDGVTVFLPQWKQTLPAIPRLPVCPGLLYFGEGDRPIAP
jgi:hypothetical protein